MDCINISNYLYNKGCSIGIHGRSIGGLCATALADNRTDMWWVCSDRSFGKLRDVAKFGVGSWADYGIYFTFNFNHITVDKWINSVCKYKIIICDNDDCVIPEMSSLKSQIANISINSLLPHQRLSSYIPSYIIDNAIKSYNFLLHIIKIIDETPSDENIQTNFISKKTVNEWRNSNVTATSSNAILEGRRESGDIGGIEMKRQHGGYETVSNASMDDSRRYIDDFNTFPNCLIKSSVESFPDFMDLFFSFVGFLQGEACIGGGGGGIGEALHEDRERVKSLLDCLQVWGTSAHELNSDPRNVFNHQKGGVCRAISNVGKISYITHAEKDLAVNRQVAKCRIFSSLLQLRHFINDVGTILQSTIAADRADEIASRSSNVSDVSYKTNVPLTIIITCQSVIYEKLQNLIAFIEYLSNFYRTEQENRKCECLHRLDGYPYRVSSINSENSIISETASETASANNETTTNETAKYSLHTAPIFEDVGYLINVHCGHNSPLSKNEMLIVDKYLQDALADVGLS
eukprot:GHVL01016861.1.p1 GENE.GHVL01016861.1~~GHVL01016861.1.p1  ORF type:complete len:594 (+),score=144.72 GHVL01016861.1:227-1783(+)